MADCEPNLDTSELYHSALDTLMNNLHINYTPNSDPSRYNNSFRRHFSPIDEHKFFLFCSTIKKKSESDNVNKDECKNTKTEDDNNKTRTPNVRETPKRSVTTTRKLKLFQHAKTTEEFKQKTCSFSNEKKLSPQSLLLKNAITRLECMERRQERMALSKKPARTSLRV